MKIKPQFNHLTCKSKTAVCGFNSQTGFINCHFTCLTNASSHQCGFERNVGPMSTRSTPTFRVSQGVALSVCWTDKLAINEQTQRTGMVIQPCLMEKELTVNTVMLPTTRSVYDNPAQTNHKAVKKTYTCEQCITHSTRVK